MINQELVNAVTTLQLVALKLNADDFSVWASFSGHVNKLSVSAIAGGYDKSDDQEETFSRDAYLDRSGALENVQSMTKDLIWHHHEHLSASLGVQA